MDKTSLQKLNDKKIFSIEGNIGSGKTTLIKYLQQFNENIILIEEPLSEWQNIAGENLLEKKNIDMERWGYSFEVYVLITKINNLIKASENYENNKIILIERCILSDKAFFDVNVKNGKCNSMENAMFNNLYNFLCENVYPKLEGVIFLDTPVDECLKRMKTRGRKEEEKIDKDYLNTLNDTFCEILQQVNCPILHVDGKYDVKNGYEETCEKILNFMQKCIEKNKEIEK
jgi:deoxyadenosine/deoxycytidine kinase